MFDQHAHNGVTFEVGANATGYRVSATKALDGELPTGSLTAILRMPPDGIMEASVTISNDSPIFGNAMRRLAARVAVHPETSCIDRIFGSRLLARTILDEQGCGTIYVQGSGRQHYYFVRSLYDEVSA